MASFYIRANCRWTITMEGGWEGLIVSPMKGQNSATINITTTVNTNAAGRDVRLRVFSDGGLARTVNIHQNAGAVVLSLSEETISFGATAGNKEVTIICNTNWTVTGGADWLTINKNAGSGNGSINVSVTDNLTTSSRSATLAVDAQGTIHRLSVTQEGRQDFTVSPTQISAEAHANSVQFSVTGNAVWTVQSNRDWATLSDLTGTGSKTITVSQADNTSESDRAVEITVSSVSKTERVTIIQQAATLPVLSAMQVADVTTSGATVTFSFTSMFPVTEYGLCYSSVNATPAKDNSPNVSLSGSSTQGTPSMGITELASGTTYYVRAYAVSVVGTQYSNAFSFTTVSDWPGGGDNVTPNI